MVNVLQHHSKASTSTTSSAPLDVTSGSHQNYSAKQRTTATADEGGGSAQQSGDESTKGHCAIPLDDSEYENKRDPRRRRPTPHSIPALPLPKFAYESRSTPSSSSRRGSLTDSYHSQRRYDARRRKKR
ncbi:unnamed protein product [Gongylonema pulchrum]|uniref:Uncharacterized protein n=1 Tax=Gongylonema pulchrum TaxID=637853 RepID=A0A3P7Q1F6_9BILA|nr:unnamed protein product [Gongylonema pulchrum]